MNTYVVDASVGFKWCVPSRGESLVRQAEELLAVYGQRQVALVVPDLFWVELGNALWKHARKAQITSQQAACGLSSVRELGMATVPSFPLLPQALEIALTYERTVYDSLYVVLASVSEAELITADERLANAMAARFPVKWLGAF